MLHRKIPGKTTIVFHQLAGRSKIFAQYSKKKNTKVFWPGCAVLTLGPDAIEPIYNALCRSLGEEIGFSSLCCGKPSYSILGKGMIKSTEKHLKQYFSETEPEMIYTLCPNCKKTLEQHFNCSAEMVWNVIDNDGWNEENLLNIRKACIHDPCPSRADIQCHEAVRTVLLKKGIEVLEPKNTGKKTMCCGRKDMLFVRNPEVSEKILDKRIAQFKGTTVITYCESCVQAFKAKGVPVYHIIEIIRGKTYSKSWKNRYFAVKSLCNRR